MATLDLLSLPEAKLAVNLSGTTQFDTELPAWITGVSLRLDEAVGPIVQRTVTGELHDGGCGSIRLELYPVSSITTVTEYDDTVATVLTAESNTSKPADAYLAGRYAPNRALLSGHIRRRSANSDDLFPAGRLNVAVTYVAGRFADTAAVSERYKRAAAITLEYLWATQRPQVALVGEFESPMQSWPKFAIPNAARDLLVDEWQDPTVRVLVG